MEAKQAPRVRRAIVPSRCLDRLWTMGIVALAVALVGSAAAEAAVVVDTAWVSLDAAVDAYGTAYPTGSDERVGGGRPA